MQFKEALSKEKGHIKSIYDLAAFCYCYLTAELERSGLKEHIFLSTQCARVHTDGRLVAEVWTEYYRTEIENVKRKGISLDDVFGIGQLCNSLLELMNSKESPKDSSVELGLIMAWSLLLACDNYAFNNSKNRYGKSIASLNSYKKEELRLYYTPDVSLYGEAMQELRIPNIPNPQTIAHSLIGLCIVTNNDIPAECDLRINSYTMGRTDREIRLNKGMLRVAVTPFTGKKVTAFPLIPGTRLFTSKHDENYCKAATESSIKIIESAIDKGCHIILFPEYMIETPVLERIQRYLKEKNPSSLLFVVAGTRWVDDDTCNEVTVLNRGGDIIAKSDKYVPYHKEIAIPGNKAEAFTENLTRPGKHLELLDIEGIGRFAFPICRDVSELNYRDKHDYLSVILKKLRPHFLLVPAWSASTDGGFLDQFINIGKMGTVSVLGNCCEPVRPRNLTELAAFPKKADKSHSRTEGIVEKISCKENIEGECPHEACFFVYDIIVNERTLTSGKIVQNVQHVL